MVPLRLLAVFFFFNDTATTEIYTLSLHDALPISGAATAYWLAEAGHDVVVVERKTFPREKTCGDGLTPRAVKQLADRKSTRLNSSHLVISYAVFCLKKKKRIASHLLLPRTRLMVA